MGHLATIYGVITSAMAGSRNPQRYHESNAKIIDQLPTEDTYPPLVKNMFAISEGKMLGWQSRAIHFGWTTKNFEEDAPEWILKFERLLMDLYWWEAKVHMHLEIHGEIELSWGIDPDSVQDWMERDLQLPNKWHRRISPKDVVIFHESWGQNTG